MESLLGEHSNLVNLDSLVQPKRGAASSTTAAKNPFTEQPNPFQAAAAPKPSMNELRGGQQVMINNMNMKYKVKLFQPQQQQTGGWPTQNNSNNSDINPFF